MGVGSPRFFFVAALIAACAGWAVFIVAAVFSSIYSDAHPMRGYEWLPGFAIVPIALLAFVRMPSLYQARLAAPDERDIHNTAINVRIGLVLLPTFGGVVGGIIMTAVGWFAPPACYAHHTSSSQAARWFHSSPSPSATPAPARCAPDPTTGSLLLAQLALLVVAVMFMWLSVTAPRGDDDDENENALF
jgi:hypothetical protein